MTLQLRPTFSESWYRVQSLKPKLRAGAQISRQFHRGERWYVVRDPAGNQYHRLSDAAYKFVGLLDGIRTISEAWELVGGQLADDAPTQPEVIQILSQLYSANLIETNISPDATVLLRRHKRMMMHKAKGRLMNILFPRIPLWDLDWFLKYFLPLLRPMLSVFGLFVWLGVVVTALVLCLPHWDLLKQQGTESIEIWRHPENAFWLYLAFAGIKFIHELGHGFMCRRFGGEVHELGIMFLVLFPAPYVDASSAWSFPNKWHRVLVGAGGMIFELFVAALCAFAWLSVKDNGGYLSLFLYNVMLIASFSTVVFNANPLLRYDGYYILSDMLEIPNLQHRSREYTLSLIKRFLFRVKWSQPLPQGFWTKFWMVVYFCFSGPYRVMVGVFIMIMVLYQLPEQIKFLGMIMGLGSLATFFIVPAYKTFTYLTVEPELHRNRGLATAWTLAFATAAVVVLCFVRFPLNVRAEAIVRPLERASIYPATPGFLTEVKKHDGEWVEKDEPIFVLRDDDLQTNIKRLTALVDGLNVQLRASQADDPVSADAVAQQLKVQESELDRALQRQRDLVIRAPIAGKLIAPLVDQQLGRFVTLAEQRPLALIAKSDRLVGYAVVSQNEVGLIREAESRARAQKRGDLPGKPINDVGYVTSVRMVSEPETELNLEVSNAHLKPAGTRDVRSVAMTNAGGGENQADPRDPTGQKLAQEEFEFEFIVNNKTGFFQPEQRAYVRIKIDQGPRRFVKMTDVIPLPILEGSPVWQGWRRLNQLIQTTRTS